MFTLQKPKKSTDLASAAEIEGKMFLSLINYRITESHFKSNPIPKGIVNFRINPNIRMDVRKGAEDFVLAITVTVKGNENVQLPFEFEVKLVGNFKISDTTADVDQLRIEASKQLYPYLRGYVATMTANANIVSYHLPLIDFDKAQATKQTEVKAPTPGTTPKPPQKGDTIIIRPIDEV